jgi:Flp pilus assembly protein TadG
MSDSRLERMQTFTSSKAEPVTGGRLQRGSMAIEYALLFLPSFALFYALISYGFIFTFVTTFGSAAEGGARAAIAVDPTAFASTADYLNTGIVPVVREQVARQLSWLPDSVRSEVLGTANQNVSVTLDNNVLTVVVGYQDYASRPFIPTVVLPFVGAVPKVPARLVSTATARL